jgi:uncharacterized membrane protein YadS
MIPQALKGLFASEKAFAGGVLIVVATVFVFLGMMTVANWQEFSKWIFGIYAAGKTVTGVASTMKNGSLSTSEAQPKPPSEVISPSEE